MHELLRYTHENGYEDVSNLLARAISDLEAAEKLELNGWTRIENPFDPVNMFSAFAAVAKQAKEKMPLSVAIDIVDPAVVTPPFRDEFHAIAVETIARATVVEQLRKNIEYQKECESYHSK